MSKKTKPAPSFPPNDDQFEDLFVKKVETEKNGWAITRSDGWCIHIPSTSPVVPKLGMPVRFYGKGVGSMVRGVYLDGRKVYYRTEAEQSDHTANQLYGKDIHEWLARWDAGETVWSISVGGIGPGYEQSIQILAVEVIRHFIATTANWWEGSDEENQAQWAAVRKGCDGLIARVDKYMGFSGAQVGAAVNLAAHLYRKGPRAVMENDAVKDRHIQVSRTLPSLPDEFRSA